MVFPWLNYAILLLDLNESDYFVFVKIKSRNGIPTGIKVSVDGGVNFTSITNVKNTIDFNWYRIGVRFYGNSISIEDQHSILSFQANNNSLMFSSFAVSENPEFIPGPYPS